MIFAHLLREYRLRRDWGLSELARAAGVDDSLVSRMEAGQRFPRRDVVMALARGLDLSDADRARLLVAAGHVPWRGLTVIWEGQLIAWHADMPSRDAASQP